MNNLITSLLIFINNPEVRDTDYQIASCLLSHCHDIRHMTIQELAEKSYVSVSTINRFLKIFGFSRYSIFKEVLNQHVHVRYSQMMERLSEQMPNQVESLLQAVLSEDTYYQVADKARLEHLCESIAKAERLILVGSDEMIAASLRFQGDFVVMGKTVLKDSMYPGNRFTPKSSDLVLIFSMTGRIFELSYGLLASLQSEEPEIYMCGHYNFLESEQFFLPIPEAVDEVVENMILDYYLTRITYHYAARYGHDC